MINIPTPEEILRARAETDLDTIAVVGEKDRPSGEFFPTGIVAFDDALDGGLRGGELITVSGRTGEGKTTWTQNLTAALQESGIPCLWFSYEMSPWYLKQKFEKLDKPASLDTMVPAELVSGQMDYIEKKIVEGWRAHACKVIFIDHLHYLIPLEGDTNNISYAVGSIVRQLKLLAVKHDVVIFLIAHTKKVYDGEELNLSSIRDSSLVAQESDYVFLVQRLREKKSKKTFGADAGIAPQWTNFSKVEIAKNRRTGGMRSQYFEVLDGKFVLSSQEAYEYLHTASSF